MNWQDHRIYRLDPFPKISDSLLNSVHLAMYADKGCLVTDFDINRLKPASYEMRFLGELHFWQTAKDGQKRKIIKKVKTGKEYTLPKNSITYILMEEEFRLPQYIAARFNLSIRNVHKGLLLGTGPLIDPGFSGRLLIPLHNLTEHDYTMTGGEGLIWVEFTKISSIAYFYEESEVKPESLIELPQGKNLRTAQQYLEKSGIWASGIISAFKGELSRAVTSSNDAKETVEKIKNIGYLALGALVLSIILGVVPLITLAIKEGQEAKTLNLQAEKRLDELEALFNAKLEELKNTRELILKEKDINCLKNAKPPKSQSLEPKTKASVESR